MLTRNTVSQLTPIQIQKEKKELAEYLQKEQESLVTKFSNRIQKLETETSAKQQVSAELNWSFMYCLSAATRQCPSREGAVGVHARAGTGSARQPHVEEAGQAGAGEKVRLAKIA